MAKPNYSFEKRQRELAKKRKKEDKLREKADRKVGNDQGGGEPSPDTDSGPGNTVTPVPPTPSA